MNTEFNILWFEDNEEWFSSIKDDIEEHLEDLCFKPRIIHYKSVLTDTLDNDLDEISFDLIFADLNLNQGDKENDKGSEAITMLRNKNILADVLFYSTDGIDKIRMIMKSEVFEGVYTCVRDDILFPDKAKQLIDKIVKRSEDFLNIRGMVMDNVSEFDEKLKDIIRKQLATSDKDARDALNAYAYEKVCKQFNDNLKKAKDYKDDFIITALDNSFLIDSHKLSMIVNKIFKESYPKYTPMHDFHDKYSGKILKERNKLAHAKKKPEAGGVFYFIDNDGNRTDFDSDKCREIRENINFYCELLDRIYEVVGQ